MQNGSGEKREYESHAANIHKICVYQALESGVCRSNAEKNKAANDRTQI